MEERESQFFRNATITIIGILILLLIAVGTILIVSTPSQGYSALQPSSTSAYTTSSYQALSQQQYSPQYAQPSKQETDTSLYQTGNQNVPPCVEPCKVRVEYANKYFLPYPRYSYARYGYYQPYPTYPRRYYPPSYNQRFFHHRIVQRDFTY